MLYRLTSSHFLISMLPPQYPKTQYSITQVALKSGQRPCTIVQGIVKKWLGENSAFLLHFLIHIHVLMLCRKFELILIKIGFFTNFKSCSKIGQKSLYYSTGSRAKFH